jgi:hypothetical protein
VGIRIDCARGLISYIKRNILPYMVLLCLFRLSRFSPNAQNASSLAHDKYKVVRVKVTGPVGSLQVQISLPLIFL